VKGARQNRSETHARHGEPRNGVRTTDGPAVRRCVIKMPVTDSSQLTSTSSSRELRGTHAVPSSALLDFMICSGLSTQV
jgi:hypothetical protein